MTKPLIGVTPLWDEQRQSLWMLPEYMACVQRAGGVPVVLPFVECRDDVKRLAQAFDGFLFTGGQDIVPALYGEAPLPECGEVSPLRDALEALLFEQAVIKQGRPALGICRGHQLFNVLLGGTLYQDLAAQSSPAVAHRQPKPYAAPQHSVELLPGTPLADILQQSSLPVNSLHHQAVKALAPAARAAAVTQEGYVEALYLPEHKFLLSVQWHPEYRIGQPDSDALFTAFLAACALPL